ncbi:hypothetical protein GCM10010485_05020 [Streptosporangium carneum]
MPGVGGTAPAGQQPEGVVEAFGYLPRRQHDGSGGGELDGQRKAVETTADLLDRRPGLGGRGPSPRGGLLGEQAGGLRQRQGREAAGHLAGNAEGLPARGEHSERGVGVEQRGNDQGALVGEALAGVEDEQRGSRARGDPPQALLSAGEVAQPHPARVGGGPRAGVGVRETRLAHAGRSGQRDEPAGAEKVAQSREFGVASDEVAGPVAPVPWQCAAHA